MASEPSHSASAAPPHTEPPGESKASRRGLMLVIVVIVAFGLGVPAWVVASNVEHGASTAVGVHLTAEQEKGRELFAKTCYVCHTLAATKSVGRIGPNLDVRVGEEVPTEAARKALVLSAILEGRAIGKGNMPADIYQGKEAEDVASFVAAVAGR